MNLLDDKKVILVENSPNLLLIFFEMNLPKTHKLKPNDMVLGEGTGENFATIYRVVSIEGHDMVVIQPLTTVKLFSVFRIGLNKRREEWRWVISDSRTTVNGNNLLLLEDSELYETEDHQPRLSDQFYPNHIDLVACLYSRNQELDLTSMINPYYIRPGKNQNASKNKRKQKDDDDDDDDDDKSPSKKTQKR